ncbi:high mobility group B protein 3-like [Silene latifolia]|uniref:high mobility group B protein 3-like n=1 Tax=Silene latifolia TaxID=37657 RepID=UPI003D772A9D
MKGGKSKADTKKAEGRLAVKKGAPAKKGKPAKDPNKPKRPPSAFFVFMEDFRVQYKQKHPNNKSVAAVGKAGGEKWKSLSDAEKAPYVQKAEKRKVDYEKNMNAYNKKLAEGPEDEPEDESDKSRSEVNDEDDGDDSGEEDEDDD